jgi:hypothetical protein
MRVRRVFAVLVLACVLPPLAAQQNAPAWVTDVNKAYPTNQWMAVVGNDRTQKAAANKALDVKTAQIVTMAREQF